MDVDDIDWSKPIEAERMPRLSLITGAPAPGGQLYYLARVRDEQVRRAKLLLDAAGAKPITPRSLEPTVARLAALVPGMRYRAGILVVSRLAPFAPFVLADPAEPTARGGRPSTWTDARLASLAAYHAEVVAETPKSDNGAMTVVRQRWLKAQKTDIAALTIRGETTAAEAVRQETVPSVKTLIGYLARGRALLAGDGAMEKSV